MKKIITTVAAAVTLSFLPVVAASASSYDGHSDYSHDNYSSRQDCDHENDHEKNKHDYKPAYQKKEYPRHDNQGNNYGNNNYMSDSSSSESYEYLEAYLVYMKYTSTSNNSTAAAQIMAIAITTQATGTRRRALY